MQARVREGVHVRLCVCVVVESDPRGPASYSLSAGDHHFHKTSIVGTELQTPETHTLEITRIHTNIQKYIHTTDKTVASLKPRRGHALFAMNKISKSLEIVCSTAVHCKTHTHTSLQHTVQNVEPCPNNSPWVVGQTIIVGVSMLIMCD